MTLKFGRLTKFYVIFVAVLIDFSTGSKSESEKILKGSIITLLRQSPQNTQFNSFSTGRLWSPFLQFSEGRRLNRPGYSI